jgi:polyisoprenoid-binding protein YceI
MMARYQLDPGRSRFTVQAFAGGLLSFAAHSPTFAVRDFSGAMWFAPGTLEGAGIEMTVRADALELIDDVRPADRQEIEDRKRREVLETTRYPDIHFRSEAVSSAHVSGNRYRLRIEGPLSLHGTTNRLSIDAELLGYEDGVRLSGKFGLRLSDYGVRPVTALGGTIRLKDELRVAFDLAAWKKD